MQSAITLYFTVFLIIKKRQVRTLAKEKKEIADLIMIEGVDCKGFGVIPKIVTTDTNLSIGAKALYAYLCSYAGNGIYSQELNAE